MSDDFLPGGILPTDDTVSGGDEFDPNAVDSDDFLDDPEDAIDPLEDIPPGLVEDDEDDDLTRDDM
jgi:hypothetical protein